jgi:hypothetical protein
MIRKERKYSRLPGRPFTPFEVRSLWQGPDHLLWVETVFFKENYKRFFYTDIQAVTLQRTHTHIFWSCVWGLLASVCGLIAFMVADPPLISGSFTAIFLLLLTANVVMGPACIVYLQTAAQIQRISSLKRVRTAQRTMTRIKALVEAVQGPWSEHSYLKAGSFSPQTSVIPGSSADMPAESTSRNLEAATAVPFKPLLHQILFGLMLAAGALGAVQFQLKNLPLAALETLIHLAVQVMVIAALARWYHQITGTVLAKINWIALFFVTLFTIIGYALYVVASFNNPEFNYHHWMMFKKVFELQWFEHPLTLAGNIVHTCGILLLGISGLLVLRRPSAASGK